MSPPAYPAWLAIWASRETVTRREACALIIGQRPDACDRSSREYKFADEQLQAWQIPIVQVPFTGRRPQVLFLDDLPPGRKPPMEPWSNPFGVKPQTDEPWYEPGYRMVDLIAAIERQREPRAFGQELLDAWNASRAGVAPVAPTEKESKPKLKKPERRKADYLLFVAEVPKKKRRGWDKRRLHKALLKRNRKLKAELWPAEFNTFDRQFWRYLTAEERDL